MPNAVEQKVVDPEAEYSNVQRFFKKLGPMCSVAKRGGGIPQLAPQEKQLSILQNEMKETQLCIRLATKGRHARRDRDTKKGVQTQITEYEHFEMLLRDERNQEAEVDILNYLSRKNVSELQKRVRTESECQTHLEYANNCLRRMENQLDMAMKRFCIVNTDNKHIREEIHRLLVERENFNKMWNRTIGKLVKGKEYMLDILEMANNAFRERDEWCTKLELYKWKGLYQLNRDIAEMQSYEGELNHLAKIEEFLRVKGSRRVCEADDLEEIKRQEEIARCDREITLYDALLEEIFAYAGISSAQRVIQGFKRVEMENYQAFIILCEMLQESIILRKELEVLRQRALDQRDINDARLEMHDRRVAEMTLQLNEQRENTKEKLALNIAAEAVFNKLLGSIDELCRISKCVCTPLMSLLGNQKVVTKWNVRKYLRILETEVKSLIQVVYGAVKPPAPTPKGRKAPTEKAAKLVADPYVEALRPNAIERLIPYIPCAYCVEDYMMNQVFEVPAQPADRDYVDEMFNLEDPNTKFGIFSLTIPSKRHPFRGSKKD